MHSHIVYYVPNIACAHLFHDLGGITLFSVCFFCVTMGRLVRYRLLLFVWLAVFICLAIKHLINDFVCFSQILVKFHGWFSDYI